MVTVKPNMLEECVLKTILKYAKTELVLVVVRVISLLMPNICIPSNQHQKCQGSLGSIGKNTFIITNFQADDYGALFCSDEENCVYN